MVVEHYSEPTSRGAASWDIAYLDNERKPTGKAKATGFIIHEYDKHGTLICSTMQDMREERGKAIADRGNQIKKVNDHSFKVKSQSGMGVYEVKATPSGMTCTCPDFVYRGGKCKHIAVTRYYLEIEKDTPQGIVTEKVHLTYKHAWEAYNTAQKVEVKLFDNLLKDLGRAIPEPEQTMGRPRLSIHETLFCAIQKVYSQLSSPAPTVSSRMQPRKGKSTMHHTSIHHPSSSIILR